MNYSEHIIVEELNDMSNISYVSDDISIDLIDENPDNALIYDMDKIDELIISIKEDGFSDPIGVYDMENGRYEVFTGHKRLHAMKQLNATTISVLIFKKPEDDIERARRLIRSNSLSRESTPLQKAKELAYYNEHVIKKENKAGVKRLQLAQEFGISQGHVTKLLALLKLIPELQELANNPDFAFSAFSPAATLSEEKQMELYQYIMSKKNYMGEISITRNEIHNYITYLHGNVQEKGTNVMEPSLVQPTYSNMNSLKITPNIPVGGNEVVPIPNSMFKSSTPNTPSIPPPSVVDNIIPHSEQKEPIIYIDSVLSDVSNKLSNATSSNYSFINRNSAAHNLAIIKDIIEQIEKKL